MKISRALPSLALVTTIACAATAYAVGTRSFVLDDLPAFQAGELSGTAAYSDGTLRRAAPLKRVAIENTSVAWSSLRAPDGTVYVGSGENGAITRVRSGVATPIAQTGELVVTSLALNGNTLYAGTIPNGRIFAIDLATSAMRELVRLDGAAHVWALVWDHHRGALIAATGPEGRIYSITPSGMATVLHDDSASHIQSLVLDEAGTLFAGTSDRALVLRIPTRGRANVVWDFPGNEIASLAYREGELLVVANELNEPAATPTPAATPPALATQAPRAARPRAGKGKLFSVSRDGRVELLASQDDAHFTSVAFGNDGAAWVASAKDGRILRIAADRSQGVVADVDERQVLSLASVEPLTFTTGDGAALYVTEAPVQSLARFTSKVLDADFHARFGALTWRGEGPISVETRSGSTTPPDDTWSDWSEPRGTPGPIESPPARFLQVRVTLGAQTSVLRSLTAHYLPTNQRAIVRDITFGARRAPTKRAEPAQATTPENAAATDDVPAPTTTLRISWRVENPDADRLRFRLDYRAESQTTWRPLTREEDVLTRPEYTWETNAIADGYYRVRVRASDEPANPEDRATTHANESGPVLVDNHAPAIENMSFTNGSLRANVSDAFSAIARLELAIDGADFRPLTPRDGILDAVHEEIDTSVRLAPGPHVLAIRAVDAGGNPSIAEIEVSVAATR